MKKKHFSEEQIALALHQAERTSVEDVTRHLGVSQATFYRCVNWRVKMPPLEGKMALNFDPSRKRDTL